VSDYQRWQARERRRALLWAAIAWAVIAFIVIVLTGTALAVFSEVCA
jgi:hypothetical protein